MYHSQKAQGTKAEAGSFSESREAEDAYAAVLSPSLAPKGSRWSNTEAETLQKLAKKHGNDWSTIAKELGTGRTPRAVNSKCTDLLKNRRDGDSADDDEGLTADKPSEWKDPEVDRLMQLVEKHSGLSADSSQTSCDWAAVAEELGTGRSANAVSLKYRRIPKQNAPSKKTSATGGSWTDTEVEMLQQLVETHGTDWTAIAKALGTNRTSKAVETKQYQISLAARCSFVVLEPSKKNTHHLTATEEEDGSMPKEGGGGKRQRKAISRFDPEEEAGRPQLARKITATGSSSISSSIGLMNQSAGAAHAYAHATTTVPQTGGAANATAATAKGFHDSPETYFYGSNNHNEPLR